MVRAKEINNKRMPCDNAGRRRIATGLALPAEAGGFERRLKRKE